MNGPGGQEDTQTFSIKLVKEKPPLSILGKTNQLHESQVEFLSELMYDLYSHTSLVGNHKNCIGSTQGSIFP